MPVQFTMSSSPKSKKSPLLAPDILPAMTRLRVEAVNKKLDMTDAFEAFAPGGTAKTLGIMAKNRFRSTMGGLFAGSIDADTLNAICWRYGAGDLDPNPNEDGYTQARAARACRMLATASPTVRRA